MEDIDRRILLGAAGLAGVAALAHAGPLAPPGGPVGSTGKTLTDVEPRTAVNATNTPGTANAVYRITQPGSYYLTGNINVPAGKIGVEVTAEDATLDLMGFMINGQGAGTVGVQGGYRGVVRNGLIREVDAGVKLGGIGVAEDLHITRRDDSFGEGVFGQEFATVRNCWVIGGNGMGIVIQTNGLVRDCSVFAAGGIYCFGVVENCLVYLTQDGNAFTVMGSVRGCTARIGSFNFLEVPTAATDCVAESGGFRGIATGTTLTNCSATGAGTGFEYMGAPALRSCVANQCSSAGFRALASNETNPELRAGPMLESCTASKCGLGFRVLNHATLDRCTAMGSAGIGFQADDRCVLVGCNAARNVGGGIRVNDSCTLKDCRTDENGGDGFNGRFGNRWESCGARSNAGHGFSTGAGAFILNCSADGNGAGAGTGANIYLNGYGCRVEGNALIGGDMGIQAVGAGNLVIRNSSSSCPNHYGGIIAGNQVGPIGSAATATSPWANITF